MNSRTSPLMSPVAKRGPLISGLSPRNWRSMPARSLSDGSDSNFFRRLVPPPPATMPSICSGKRAIVMLDGVGTGEKEALVFRVIMRETYLFSGKCHDRLAAGPPTQGHHLGPLRVQVPYRQHRT